MMMKDGVIIVNTARGPIINTQDLIEFIENGKIAGVGLDVYEYEKGLFFYDHSGDVISDELFKSLQAKPNVLITSHQGFLTVEALTNIAETTIANIESWGNGKILQNELKVS